MLEIVECIRAMHDAVFIGKFSNEKVILKLINQVTYGIPIEAEIVNFITMKNPRIKIPKILSIIKLDNAQLENIINTYDLVDLFDSAEISKLTNIYLIVFEYIEGNILSSVRVLANKRKIASYIQMLHDISIVHGDIKEDNFIDTGSEIYVIDFGCSFDANFDINNETKWKPCSAAIEDSQNGCRYATNKISDWINFIKMVIRSELGRDLSISEYHFIVDRVTNNITDANCFYVIDDILSKMKL